MKKEVLLAIIIGFAIGLIITFGIYTAKKALNQYPNATQATPTPTPVSTTPSHTLTITQPETETVHDQDTLTLTGTTSPDSIVTIFTEEDETIVSADSTGKFSAPIKLIGGANDITVTAITSDGLTATAELTLVYSTVTIEP